MKRTLLISFIITGVCFGQTHEFAEEFYKNEIPKVTNTYKESRGKLELVKQVSWYDNGQKRWEGTYKDGEIDGAWTSWDENGQKVWEGTIAEYKAEETRKAEEARLAEDPGLKSGDLAPSWALKYSPGKFEFLKNWTVERDKNLRKFLSQPDRHPVVLIFFATWCKPCIKQLPHLENVFQAYKNEKVKFFLVDITEATRAGDNENSPKAGPFLAEKGVTIPILYDNRGVAKERYGVKTIPRFFVIDKFQIIREAKVGYMEGEDIEGELTALIDELMAENVDKKKK